MKELMTIDATRPDPSATILRKASDTELHFPGEPGYDAARTPWNVAVDLRPAAVAHPTTSHQISEVVTAARQAGLRVAPQSTGHNARPLAQHDLSDVVLMKTSAMTDVSINPDTQIARVEGGTLWLDVIEAAGRFGLAALHGSSPDVGVAGYGLGGGIFLYARKLGMANNSLTAVELVVGDGTLVRADHEQNTELFWALRGGGGNFGVVTALEFTLFPIETVYAGMMLWERRDAERVVRRWADWAPGAPEEITTTLRMLNMPALPELPDVVRGRELVCIDGAILDSDERSAEILAGLRELEPEVDTFERVRAPELARLHMDPEGPTPVVADASMLHELPDSAVDAYLAEVGPDSASTLLTAELRQLGGALARPHPNGGALDRLDGQFLLFGAAVAASPEQRSAGQADAHQLTKALAPWSNRKQYLNFAENAVDPKLGYSTDSWERLGRIRSGVDPDEVFLANHVLPVPPPR